MTGFSLDDLAAIIRGRRGAEAEESYTRSLLDKGAPHCARKLGEEATETIIAALQGDKAALRSEAADLLYHLLVLLEACGEDIGGVLAELERRTARSGHAEKAARAGK